VKGVAEPASRVEGAANLETMDILNEEIDVLRLENFRLPSSMYVQ
jgi:hypothetical protein